MRSRLLATPLLALALAALDVSWVRSVQWHRPVGWTLWWQTLVLWSLFVLLAIVPASLLSRWIRGRRPPEVWREGRWRLEVPLLLYCAGAPVLAHRLLDRHTRLGQDLSGLAQPPPWIEAGLWVLAAFVGLRVFSRLFERRSAALAAAVLLVPCLALGLAWPPRPERFPPREDPAAPVAPLERPNLLLMVWDTTRARSVSAYEPDERTTPHLAELASDALLFEEARSVATYTLTSHVSMLTGTYPSHHGARLLRMNFDRRETPSVARVLHDAGYRTGAFVGTGVLRANTGIVDGFEVYDDLVDPPVCDTAAWALVHDVQALLAKVWPQAFNRDGDPHWIQDFQRPAPEVLGRALEWIASDDPRPWFCVVNLYDVHWPYLPSAEARERLVEPYDGIITGRLFRADDYQDRPNGGRDGSLLDERDKRHLTELYEAELWQLDRDVDAFLARLAEHEPEGLDDVGVVITADHGEAFGEGGLFEHADVLEPQVRVPLIVKPPREHPAAELGGRRVHGKVSGVDVGPTMLGLAGIQQPMERQPDGTTATIADGVDLSRAEPDLERLVLVEDRDHPQPDLLRYVIYSGPWKYVRTGLEADGREELFDLRNDEDGLNDVSAEHPDLVAELRAAMKRLRARWSPDDERDATAGLGIRDAGALRQLGYAGN